MRKLDKMAETLNEDFNKFIADAMREQYGIEVETGINLSFQKVTTRVDGKNFTPTQHAFLAGLSAGYGEAVNRIREADHD